MIRQRLSGLCAPAVSAVGSRPPRLTQPGHTKIGHHSPDRVLELPPDEFHRRHFPWSAFACFPPSGLHWSCCFLTRSPSAPRSNTTRARTASPLRAASPPPRPLPPPPETSPPHQTVPARRSPAAPAAPAA